MSSVHQAAGRKKKNNTVCLLHVLILRIYLDDNLEFNGKQKCGREMSHSIMCSKKSQENHSLSKGLKYWVMDNLSRYVWRLMA